MRSTHDIEDEMLDALRTIRTHWALMQLGTSSASSGGSPSSDIINAVDRRISLTYEVLGNLNSWARVVVEDRDLQHDLPLGHDALGLVELLERHARWMSGHEAGQDCADELTKWAGKVKRMAVPPVKDWISLGECPITFAVAGAEDVAALPCAGEVRAYQGKDPTCQRCNTEAVWSWWEKRMRPDAQDLVSAEDLVSLLYRAFGKPVKPTTIRQWVSRGDIEPRACSLGTRRHLFDREDAIVLAARRHAA